MTMPETVVCTEVNQKAAPVKMPPMAIQGERRPKREWHASERAPKTRLEMSAKMLPAACMEPRTASELPGNRSLKRCGSRTAEPMVPDIIHITPKMMKPMQNR